MSKARSNGFEEASARADIVSAARAAYERGINSILSGNISVRAGSGMMLITPTGVPVNRLTERDISLFDIDKGRLVSGPKQSSEWMAHAFTYRSNRSVGAIVHVHPYASIALYSAIGKRAFDISQMSRLCSDEEIDYYIGRVGFVGNIRSGTEELASGIAGEFERGARIVIMEGHGTIAIGKTVDEALSTADYLELVSKKVIADVILRGIVGNGSGPYQKG